MWQPLKKVRPALPAKQELRAFLEDQKKKNAEPATVIPFPPPQLELFPAEIGTRPARRRCRSVKR